jgi:Spy/CpxP family protein refolding chaperone
MNVLKNFEALFVVTVALACGATYALDKSAVATHDANMQVVVVSAKRLTPEQKLQSLLEDRATTLAADAKKADAI